MPKTRQQILYYTVAVTTPLDWTDEQNEAMIEKISDSNIPARILSRMKSMISGLGVLVNKDNVQIEVVEE